MDYLSPVLTPVLTPNYVN